MLRFSLYRSLIPVRCAEVNYNAVSTILPDDLLSSENVKHFKQPLNLRSSSRLSRYVTPVLKSCAHIRLGRENLCDACDFPLKVIDFCSHTIGFCVGKHLYP